MSSKFIVLLRLNVKIVYEILCSDTVFVHLRVPAQQVIIFGIRPSHGTARVSDGSRTRTPTELTESSRDEKPALNQISLWCPCETSGQSVATPHERGQFLSRRI